MEFNLPETQEQMYVILNDLFHHYRINLGQFQDVGFEPLQIERLTYTEMTDQQITAKATQNLSGKHQREISDRQDKITMEINKITAEITETEKNSVKAKEKIEILFNESVEKLKKQIIKSGLINSTIYVDKLAVLESGKNEQIIKAEQESNEKKAQLNSELNALRGERDNSSTYFTVIHKQEIKKEEQKIRDEESKKKEEIFIYNNGLDEKEKRYRNHIKQTNASLHLKFMDIRSKELTKEELIEMGYYEDVIKCVCGYYDRLAPDVAFSKIFKDKKLCLYLDDYYQDVVYIYKLNSAPIQ